MRALLMLLAGVLTLVGASASAMDFPPLSGRVVDAANILAPDTEAQLTQQLAALQTQSGHQLVVATLPSLDGNDVADVGYQLGRAWGIGDKEHNDGVILLVAPNERRVTIAVGYGLEATLTDALSASIIRNQITPRFREGNYDAGVLAGVAAIAHQIELPPDQAAQVARQAAQSSRESGNASWGGIIFWVFVILIIVFIFSRGGSRGSRYGRGPVVIWGGGSDFGGGGSSWGGGSGWGGGGGFSGGGGSFGGGGASGGW